MEKKSTGGMNVGTSSVLVAFVLLCLVTFAGLSFLSANSDYRLSRQTADKTTEYYTASTEADRRLAQLDDILTECAATNSEASYYEALADRFAADSDYTYQTEGDVHALSFIININERQDLNVILDVRYPTADDTRTFVIRSYSVVVNASWQDEIRDEIDENGLLFN